MAGGTRSCPSPILTLTLGLALAPGHCTSSEVTQRALLPPNLHVPPARHRNNRILPERDPLLQVVLCCSSQTTAAEKRPRCCGCSKTMTGPRKPVAELRRWPR